MSYKKTKQKEGKAHLDVWVDSDKLTNALANTNLKNGYGVSYLLNKLLDDFSKSNQKLNFETLKRGRKAKSADDKSVEALSAAISVQEKTRSTNESDKQITEEDELAFLGLGDDDDDGLKLEGFDK